MKNVVTIVLMLALATVAQAQTVQYLFDEGGGASVGNSGSLGALADGAVINGEGDELSANPGLFTGDGGLGTINTGDHVWMDSTDLNPVFTDNGTFTVSLDFTPAVDMDGTQPEQNMWQMRDSANPAGAIGGSAHNHTLGIWGNRMEFHVQWRSLIDGSSNRYRAQWKNAAGGGDFFLNAGQTYNIEAVFGADRVARLIVDGIERATKGPAAVWESVGAPHIVSVGGNYIGEYEIDGTIDNFNITPEPTTMAILGLGSLVALRRKRRA